MAIKERLNAKTVSQYSALECLEISSFRLDRPSVFSVSTTASCASNQIFEEYALLTRRWITTGVPTTALEFPFPV